MFVLKQKYKALNDKVQSQEERIENMFRHIIDLNEKLDKLREQTEEKPNYFD
jgi:uncharacterized coiled-coil protein SlyX